MTYNEFDVYFEEADLFSDYMYFISENNNGERMICNGDMLIEAAESGYLYEEFRDYWIKKNS